MTTKDKPAFSKEELDEVVDNTTAFKTLKELVRAMRSNDGYGQKYTPTLRPDHAGPYEEGLHAVRAEAQRLGFRVWPEDTFYAKPNDIPEPEPPKLEDVTVEPKLEAQEPELEEPDEYVLEI